MLYGATINGVHTLRDLQLYPTAKFIASPPEPQTYYVEVPGLDGYLDLTESMDGLVHYKNRTLSMPCKCIAPRDEWSSIYSRMLNAFHGRQVKIILGDDPNYYYLGRITVEAPDMEKKQWYVNIMANVAPFKFERFDSTEPWLWDPFCFSTDIARDYTDLTVRGVAEYKIASSVMPVSPVFAVVSVDGSGVRVAVNGELHELPEGTSSISGFLITSDTVFTFFGNAEVTIGFRGGLL